MLVTDEWMMAELLRALHRLGILDWKTVDGLIDDLQIRLWTKEKDN